jgi:hypothetical protein
VTRTLVPLALACALLGAVAVAQGAVNLRFSGEIRAAGPCSTVAGEVFCSLPEGSAGSLTLVATATPVRTVHIALVSFPRGWPGASAVSGWGTATAQYAFTPPAGSAGQRVELVFQARADGVAPVELRVVLDITAPAVASCEARPPLGGVSTATESPTLDWDSARPLVWSDFWAPPPLDPAHPKAAEIAMSLLYTVEHSAARDPATGAWRAHASSLVVRNAMERDRSWVAPGHATPAVLNHEQRHFDLNEVYRRVLLTLLGTVTGSGRTAQAAKADFQSQAEAIFQRVTGLNAEMQARYDRETDHGRDAARQAEWDKRIANWLLDPRLAPQP